MIKKGYIYPLVEKKGSMQNPYIENFMLSLAGKIEFVNKDRLLRFGIIDVFRYLPGIHIVFLNWPEEIPGRKGGPIQFLIYILLLKYFRLNKIKIVWTLHNKESHIKKNIALKRAIRRFTARKSDYIITHAQEGKTILEKMETHAKVKFIQHPVPKPTFVPEAKEIIYDVLIWGTVTSYKGVNQFLRFIKEERLDHIQILVAGKVDSLLKPEIESYAGDNITLEDRIISDKEIGLFISKSRAVLFTYLDSSVLSSGALMESLSYETLIIGPDFGSFRDLKEEGLILTYSDFTELKEILLHQLNNEPPILKIREFNARNTWSNFGTAVYNFVSGEN